MIKNFKKSTLLLTSTSLLLFACSSTEEDSSSENIELTEEATDTTDEDASNSEEDTDTTEVEMENSDTTEVDSNSNEDEQTESSNEDEEFQSVDGTTRPGIDDDNDSVGEVSLPANSHVSNLVDMDSASRREYHESLASYPEETDERVYEHLMLPGLHENTEVYEGRINPGDAITFSINESVDNGNEDLVRFSPTTDDQGYFELINLNRQEINAEDEIIARISEGYSLEQVFIIPVYESEENMEWIRVME